MKKDGSIDKKRIANMVERAYPMEVTFHRAFDRCIDPFEALEEIIDAGCQRILTSGQQPTAIEGVELIKKLISIANGRIVIMPGSGLKKENIREVAELTGAEEFHAALRNTVKSKMEFLHPFFKSAGNYEQPGILEEEVQAFKHQLNAITI